MFSFRYYFVVATWRRDKCVEQNRVYRVCADVLHGGNAMSYVRTKSFVRVGFISCTLIHFRLKNHEITISCRS